jgi:hypothetical protein
MDFVRSLWSRMGFSMPGMAVPTFSLDELDKRITDLKAVEGWLQMNLSMLQMTIQGLEVQKTTLSTAATVSKIISQSGRENDGESAFKDGPTVGETLHRAALWPWDVMQKVQTQIQQHLDEQAKEAAASAAAQQEQQPPKKKSAAPAAKRPAAPRKPARGK